MRKSEDMPNFEEMSPLCWLKTHFGPHNSAFTRTLTGAQTHSERALRQPPLNLSDINAALRLEPHDDAEEEEEEDGDDGDGDDDDDGGDDGPERLRVA